jgi:peroxiredoxin
MMTIEVGQAAPDFELKDQNGQPVRLADYRGKQPVALVFYPFAFSGVCTGELCEIRDNLTVFTDSQVQVLAISCDPVYSLKAWAEAEKYEFLLLSDFWPHGAVAQQYGVFADASGRAERGTFLVDAEGIVRWSVLNAPGQPRPLAAYRQAIAAL